MVPAVVPCSRVGVEELVSLGTEGSPSWLIWLPAPAGPRSTGGGSSVGAVRDLDVQALAADEVAGHLGGTLAETDAVVVHRVALRVVGEGVEACNKRNCIC